MTPIIFVKISPQTLKLNFRCKNLIQLLEYLIPPAAHAYHPMKKYFRAKKVLGGGGGHLPIVHQSRNILNIESFLKKKKIIILLKNLPKKNENYDMFFFCSTPVLHKINFLMMASLYQYSLH